MGGRMICSTTFSRGGALVEQVEQNRGLLHRSTTTPPYGGGGGWWSGWRHPGPGGAKVGQMNRRIDAIESIANALVGVVVSIALTYAALPLWGLDPSLGDSIGITAMFFAASTARAYALRRMFRRIA